MQLTRDQRRRYLKADKIATLLQETDFHIYDEDDDYDEEFGSASKRRRRSVKVKKSNKAAAVAHNILQKLCTIIGFLKDFAVDRAPLKAISLIGGIFYLYTHHRVYVMDELLHLLMKLPFSKRIPRTYHLADEEQRQIQMITGLLIQLIHFSGNLPSALREAPDNNPLFNIGIDSSYPLKSQKAVTEACCLFWSRVLQRFANTKNQNQDASEFKIMLENLVIDLLATLNLPQYPASAHILEVLCVLQNAGLKSKDVTARSIAIDVLGTVAARLKRDAVLCKKEKFWIVQELLNEDDMDYCPPDDACSIVLFAWIQGSKSHWSCVKKTTSGLQSYCKAQGGGEGNHTRKKILGLLRMCIYSLDDDPPVVKRSFSITLPGLKLEQSCVHKSFSRGFDKILHLLLASLREGSPVIRAKALRAVSIIVEADPEVLALELVGRYIASHPNVALRYYGKVAERVKDTGMSVRKRAIKIIRDMSMKNPAFRTFVCKTFCEFWFEEPSGSQNLIFAEGSSVTVEIAKKTDQMVEMLRKMPNHQLLVTVIKRNLSLIFCQSAEAVGISPVMLASLRKRCELMCECLLEKILRKK
nr:sister chromatid cohesion protein SCC2 isoform X2 [Tanacetum cinerariifolium]